MSKILIIDGHNFMHRARSGFQLGDFNIVFNFVRNLRALVELMKPTKVYFTLEGEPKRALALLPEYKANRVYDPNDPKASKDLGKFLKQKPLIIELLKNLPITVVKHPDFEADDVIYNLVKSGNKVDEFTIVSTDTDFIQMLQEFHNVKLYNPVTKAYVEPPPYNYVCWKALSGDTSDNVPGIVSDSVATQTLTCEDSGKALGQLLELPGADSSYTRNVAIIMFKLWTPAEARKVESSQPTKDWDNIRRQFESMAFKSLLKEGTWDKFVATFESL